MLYHQGCLGTLTAYKAMQSKTETETKPTAIHIHKSCVQNKKQSCSTNTNQKQHQKHLVAQTLQYTCSAAETM